jgi:hypothetical protein
MAIDQVPLPVSAKPFIAALRCQGSPGDRGALLPIFPSLYRVDLAADGRMVPPPPLLFLLDTECIYLNLFELEPPEKIPIALFLYA